MANDIILDQDNDLALLNGDFVVGDSYLQDVCIILQMSQGELKSDPFMGANLTTNIRGVKNDAKIKRHIEKQLQLDGKDYDLIKDRLTQK